MTVDATQDARPDALGSWPALSLAQAHALMTQPGAVFEIEELDIRGVKTRVWKNGPKTFVDLFAAGRAWGERIFMVYEGERVSYDAFARAALVFARELQEAGLKKGDRVAIAMRNMPEWPVAFFAASLAGAVVTPLNAWWTGQELEYGLIDSGARIAILDAERLHRLAERLPECPALECVYVARDDEELSRPRLKKLEDIIGRPDAWAQLPDTPLPDVAIDPEDNATILYTSGTTGAPKGALGTHRNAMSNVLTAAISQARSFVRRGEAPPAPDPNAPQKVGLLAIPFFHVTGLCAVLGPTIFGGSRIVMMRRWEPEAAFAMIEKERVTLTGGVPTIAWQLLEHPARLKYDLSSLDTVSYGGAPAAAELVRRLKEAFPKSQPGTGWGMTETSGSFTHHYAEDYQHRPESCGPASPVCEMKVVGSNGETVPPGEVGELWGKGPGIVVGYWNKPQASAETFVDGWVKTGDLARIDEEGFCYIVDRAKDMIIRGGENIYSAEVEAVLYEHPDVLDAGLVPIPHQTLGEEPGAVVTLKAGSTASEDDLRAHVADRLAAFKVPVRVILSRDMLPRNANGKILKGELKKLFVPAP
ncbi:MAG TPA: class I adenylate-forming enzyme family protein [Caulobacteraceae bacterium]|jgi:long-chain acyl-CoA synthetase